MTTPAPTWSVPREAHGVFAGPLDLTVTANGDPVDPSDVKFAVLPSNARPADTDWAIPATNPDGPGVGVTLDAVAQPGIFGWWVQITVAGAVDVLEPSAVGWIRRT